MTLPNVAPSGLVNCGIHRLVERDRIQASDLFDSAFYLKTNPDVEAAGVDPLDHFLDHGAREGRNPHPLFDNLYYRTELQPSDNHINPLIHFITIGAFERRRPNWLFDPDFYFREYLDVMASGLNPLRHYILYGANEGRRTHPLFDTAYYRMRYPDVATSGMNPLVHFLTIGAAEGRSPCPLFDPKFYVRQCSTDPAALANPLRHFIETGAAAGLKPHPLFDTQFYRSRNTIPQGTDPLSYFLDQGATTFPNAFFDGAFYWRAYPDVAAQEINPLVHFVTQGAHEGRWPHPLFNPAAYLARYPDAADAHRNALEHFIASGEQTVAQRPVKQPKSSSRFKRRSLSPLSVVIPAQADSTSVVPMLQACRQYSVGCEVEFIVLGDRPPAGIQAIHNVRWEKAMGWAAAFNIGCSAAAHEVVLLLGDDLTPLDEHFFHVHASLHASNPDNSFAVQGNVFWPDGDHPGERWELAEVRCNESDAELVSRRFVNYRYFCSGNLSLKKSLVRDWTKHGFDRTQPAGMLDGIDLAYRLSTGDDPVRLFYDPSAAASHQRPCTLSQWLDREFNAGRSVQLLVDRFPAIADDFGWRPLVKEMSRHEPSDLALAPDYTVLIAGLKTWVRMLDSGRRLPSKTLQNVRVAIFELCRSAGFLSGYTAQDNSRAYRHILNRFTAQLRRTLHEDALGALSHFTELAAKANPTTSVAAHG